MSSARPNAFIRLFRGETSFDFVSRWRRWFAISGIVIVAGAISLGVRGLNFSIEFRGGTQWTVPTSASVSATRDAIGAVNPLLRQANIQQLVNRQTGQKEIEVSAPATTTNNNTEVTGVTAALAKLANVPSNEVNINAIGPSWGADITDKAVRAVIIFLAACAIYIWLRFEGKMALAALVALGHDMLVTAGIYSLSGFQVSPDTVIAFLTILGYSLYDTIVVFDKVQENTRGLASTGRVTYSDTVNLSMNQVLARSLNTSLVAILPILSILVIGSWVMGASALNDFGLALLIGLATGAYSSIFIASPLVALLKEREPRYAQIRQRLAARPAAARLTPAAAAAGALPAEFEPAGPPRPAPARPRKRVASSGSPAPPAAGGAGTPGAGQQRSGTGEGRVPVSSQPGQRKPPSDVPARRSSAASPAPAAPAPTTPTAPGGSAGSTGGAGGVTVGDGERPGNGAANGHGLVGGTPVPARSPQRPPPRPRKKRRR